MSVLNKFDNFPLEIQVQILKQICCVDTYVVLYESAKYRETIENYLVFINVYSDGEYRKVGEMQKKMPGVKAYQYSLSEQHKLLQEWDNVDASVRDTFFIVSKLHGYGTSIEPLMSWVNICSKLKLHHFLVVDGELLLSYRDFDRVSFEMDAAAISKYWHGTKLCNATEFSLTEDTPLTPDNSSNIFLNALTTPDTISSLNKFDDYAPKTLEHHLPLHQLKILSLNLGLSYVERFFNSVRNFISLKQLSLEVGIPHNTRSLYYRLEDCDMPELESLHLEARNDHVKFEIRNCHFSQLKNFWKNQKCNIRLIENCDFGSLERFELHSDSFLSIDGLKLPEAKTISITGDFCSKRTKNNRPAKFANIQVSKLEDLEITSSSHLRSFKKAESSGRSQYVPKNITILANSFRWDIIYHYNALKRYKLDMSKVNVSFEFPAKIKSEKSAVKQLARLFSAHPYLRVDDFYIWRRIGGFRLVK